jgi:cytochrome c heme-lyase
VNPDDAKSAYLKEPTPDFSYDRSKIEHPDFVPGLLTIPSSGHGNSDDGSTWVQPSPEQIFRAVRGKGMDLNEEDAFLMALYHSDVVEASWKNIIHDWEQKYIDNGTCTTPTLRKFEGLYGQDTLKAQAMNVLFKTPLPYDRHDWVIDRCGKDVRYIVEYYDLGAEGTSIDIRPAFDSIDAFKDRFLKAMEQAKKGEKWY